MKRSLSNIVFMVIPIWKESKTYVIFNVLLSLENIPRRLLNVLVVQYMVDAAVLGGNFRSILLVGLLYLVYCLVSMVGRHLFVELYRIPKEEKIRKNIRYNLYQKASKLDISCYDDASFYDKYTKAFVSADEKCISVFNKLIKLLGALLSIGTLSSVILSLSPIVVIAAFLGCTLSLLADFYRGRLAYRKDEALTPINRKLNYVNQVFHLKSYAKDVRTETLTELLFQDYETTYRDKIKQVERFGKKKAVLSILFDTPLESTDMFMWLFIAYQIIKGSLGAGSFMALSNAAWSLSNQLRGLFKVVTDLNKDSIYIENIRVFENYTVHVSNAEYPLNISAKEVKTLAVKDCSFSYDEKASHVVKHISFSASKGEKISIVGHNGAGKSTIVKLLLRLYDPTQGGILLNGVDYRSYDLTQLRNCFSVVFQDYQYYAYTIAENILMRPVKNSGDEQTVWGALKKVGLFDKIQKLPLGIHTQITKEFGNDGVVFSGGEFQKLAIARALVKDTPIVIMDEPSSALDPISEDELHNLMTDLFRDKILIIISHKLSMTKKSDTILYLDHGEIAEMGSHEDLLQANRGYATMWNLQSEKYIN